jgi:hypothetical protein
MCLKDEFYIDVIIVLDQDLKYFIKVTIQDKI